MIPPAVSFLVALLFGVTFGLLTGYLSLPSPSPPTVAGVLAVCGSVIGIHAGVRLIGLIL
jgi:XapX domain-containing protein